MTEDSLQKELRSLYKKKILEYLQTLELYTVYGDRDSDDPEIKEIEREIDGLRSKCLEAGCDISDLSSGNRNQDNGFDWEEDWVPSLPFLWMCYWTYSPF